MTEDQRADYYRDLRKHDWRPGDPVSRDQQIAVARLVGACEGVVSSGLLDEDGEVTLRKIIAEALVAFNMPSVAERVPA